MSTGSRGKPVPPIATRDSLLGSSSFAKTSKELIDFAGKIRALGAPADLHLPRVVVIGNQSAGKSSLVEAISGIHVPRDAGTCTRCPMECRLNHTTDSWSCQIYIRWEFDSKGNKLDDIREVPFGDRLSDPRAVEPMLRRAQASVLNPLSDPRVVEPMLRRAQAAVLNPTVDPATTLNLSGHVLSSELLKLEGKKPLQFSRNVVCVELAGPDLVDLSFVDLPGIVQNAEAEVVKLVEDLVTSYINDQCLILVTLPMSDDIENQKAARLAKLADPNGTRTIGVLTKPDMLAIGSTKVREMWLEVIEGQRHPLTHGYFCTRQPDDDERTAGISSEDARAAETRFFEETAPWATSTHRHRFGTANLVNSLSKLLTQIIQDDIPLLQEKVSAQLLECDAALGKLPPPITTEPSAFVLTIVTTFCEEVKRFVHGGTTDENALVQCNKGTYEAFKMAIRSTAPPFVPYESASKAPSDLSEYIWIPKTGASAGQKKGRKPEDVPRTNGVMYLKDVHDFINSAKGRELPNNVPYPAKTQLIHQFQQLWEGYFMECFEQVEEAFKEQLQELIRTRFDRYPPLKAVLAPAVLQLVSQRREETLRYLQIILKLEGGLPPYTQNDHYYSAGEDKRLTGYKNARAGKTGAERVTPMFPSTASHAFSSIFGIAATPPLPPSTGGTFSFAPPKSNGTSSTSSNGSATPAPSPLPFSFAKPNTSSSSSENGLGVGLFRPSTPKPAPNGTSSADPEEQKERDKHLAAAVASLALVGIHITPDELVGKVQPTDEYERELKVMAEVRAYFQVAYKRVIDYVPMSIDWHFLFAFCDALQGVLFERLGLGGENAGARCAAYIAEDAGIAARREALVARHKRLDDVRTALFNFGL